MEQTIRLRDLLHDELDPSQFKVHCAIFDGEARPLDVFTNSPEDWIGWNSWRGDKDDFNRQFVFSLIQLPDEPNRWLFGGAFEVVGRRPEPHARSYDVEPRDDVLPDASGA